MKRLITTLTLALFSIVLIAQNTSEKAIKFMGVPVDGSQRSVEFALRQKGFRRNRVMNCLEGSFNGRQSYVYIHTNHKRVDRIFVVDKQPMSAIRAKDYFNVLISQLEDKEQYFPLVAELIPNDEDVEYEITVNKKRYEASYVYIPPEDFSDTVNEVAQEALAEVINGERANMEYDDDLERRIATKLNGKETGQLSFTIQQFQEGKYQVAIFYDNLVNRPHGEDL